MPSSLARRTSSSAVEAPRRNEKFVVTANSAYAGIISNSRKQTVQIPMRARNFAAVETLAIKPHPRPAPAFNPEIIARELVAAIVAPPFHGDALRPFGLHDVMFDLPPIKLRGRSIRNFGRHIDGLRPLEQPDRANGASDCLVQDAKRATPSASPHAPAPPTTAYSGMCVSCGDQPRHAAQAEASAEPVDQMRQLLAVIGPGQSALQRIAALGDQRRKPDHVEAETGIDRHRPARRADPRTTAAPAEGSRSGEPVPSSRRCTAPSARNNAT